MMSDSIFNYLMGSAIVVILLINTFLILSYRKAVKLYKKSVMGSLGYFKNIIKFREQEIEIKKAELNMLKDLIDDRKLKGK